MADWFKIDANILSDNRIRYCISRNHCSITVFLWCLCQCCRERADHFDWDGIEADVVGLGLVLNMPPKDVEDSITILSDAKLIAVGSQIITVLHWEKHQSEYLSRRAYFAKRYKKHSHCEPLKSTVKHSEALLEEKRGEERRREESTEYTHSEDVRRGEPPPSPVVETATPKACVFTEKPENPNGKNRELFELQQRTEWLKAEIGKIYRRPDGCNWVHDEETLLCEVARRPASKSEYREIAAYRGRLAPQDRRFFPQSIRSLLTGWDATLDKARVHVDTTPKTIADKMVDEAARFAKQTINELKAYEASSQV